MKFSFFKVFTFAFSLFVVMSMFSCVEDEISGCTDPAAENYNVNAINDSGDCAYASDQMIGSYLGTSQCSGSLTNPGFNSSSLNFSIAKSATGGENDVEVSFSFETIPFVFSGVVTGNELVIDDEITGVNYPNPGTSAMEDIVVDVEATGTFTYFDDNVSIACNDFFMRIKSASGATIQDGMCSITGLKQ